MAKFTPEEKSRVLELVQRGKSYIEVAEQMKTEFPKNWSSSYAHRSVSRIIKENETTQEVTEHKTLDEMSRDERFNFVERRLQGSARFRIAFKNFDDENKELFISEYLSILKSTDTLTEPEEQHLFSAVLEYVLALQALGRKELEERWRDDSLAGVILPDDPKYRKSVDDKYQREYNQHMTLYQKSMSELKMSRSQRLKEIRSQKQTLVDLAEELSNKNAQSEIADEIDRLARLKDNELKKLLENGHVHGVFSDL